MSLRSSRRASRAKLHRFVSEFLEGRLMLAADPAFLVNFNPGIYQGNLEGLSTPLQPTTVNNAAGASKYGFAVSGDFDGGATDPLHPTYLDYQYGYAFSDTTPLSPSAATMTSDGSYGIYNGASTKFYGGIVATEYNAPGYTGWGDNPDVGRTGIFSRIGANGTGMNFESLVYWKKEDFLTGSTTSNLTLDMAKAYFKGTFTQHGIVGRWVVRDGSQFYISQSPMANDNANARDNVTDRYLQGSALSSMQWAPYDPSGTNLHFDASSATWAAHTFTNVTAVGYFAQREYSETQHVTMTGLTAGTFTITFNGKTTAPIPWNIGVDTNQNGFDRSVVSYCNDTFGYFSLRPHGAANATADQGFDISFDGGNQTVSPYAYQDVGDVAVNFDAAAVAAGASATVAETYKGGSVVRYDNTADAWMGVTHFEASRSGRMNGDNIAVDTASYLGGATGSSSINATAVMGDGSILLGGSLANDPAFATPVNLTVNGVVPTTGTILKLDSTGTVVEGVINVGSDIKDLQIRSDGETVAAVSGIGTVVLNASAFTTDVGAVAWFRPMADIRRISVGTDNMVAALSSGKLIELYSADGLTVVKSTTFGWSEVNDVVLDTADHTVVLTGTNYLTSQVVKMPILKSYDYLDGQASNTLTAAWQDYGWSQEQANAHYGDVLSDSIGDRLKIGADGYLYMLGHADGGASVFNWEPVLDDTHPYTNLGAKLKGFDTYARPGDHANAAVHYTFIGKYAKDTGAVVSGNWELAVNGSTKKGNTVNSSDMAIGTDGQVYITGSEASEQVNRDGLAIDDISLSGYNGYETFVMVLATDFSARQRWNVFTLGDPSLANNPDHHGSGGNAIAVGADGKIVLGGQIYQGMLYTTSNALQPSVPEGHVGTPPVGAAHPVAAAGYFAVLPVISQLPDAPTKLTATAHGAYQVSLTWQRNTRNDTNTIVERSLDGVNWTQLADLSSYTGTKYTPASGYWDETVDRAITYSYRVKVYNAQGSSTYSNVVSITTPATDRGPWAIQFQQPTDQSIDTTTNTAAIDSNLKYTIHAQYDPWVNGSGLGGHGINRGEKYVGLVQKLKGDGAIIVHRTSDSIDQSNFVQSGIAFQESLVKGEAGKVVSMVNGQFVTWDGVANTIQSSYPSTINNPWWKLVRVGNSFSAYYSANGATWTQAGTTQTVALPDEVFVVVAGQSSYEGINTLTANFDNVMLTHLGGTTYSSQHDENVYVQVSNAPKVVSLGYEGTDNNSAINPYFNATGAYYQFSAGNGISGSGAESAISGDDGTMVYKNGFNFTHANDQIVASQFVKLQGHTGNAQIIGLGLLPTNSSSLGGGSTQYINARLSYGMSPATGYALQVQKGNGVGTFYTSNIDASKMIAGHWYKLTNTYTNTDGTHITLTSKLDDYGTDGLQAPTTVAQILWSDISGLSQANFTDQGLNAGSVYVGYRGYSTAGAQYYDNFAVTYSTLNDTSLQSLAVYEDVPGAPAGTPTYRVQKSAVDSLLVDPQAANDSLTVDNSAGVSAVPTGGITFTGGSGTNTLTVIGSGPTDAYGVSTTQITHGSGGPISYTDVADLNLKAGAYGTAVYLGSKQISLSTAASLNIGAWQTLTSLSINDTSSAQVAAGGDKILSTGALTIAQDALGAYTGKLDLANNVAIVQSGDVGAWDALSSKYTGFIGAVASGRNGGLWNGTGVQSSAAAADTTLNYGLAVMTALQARNNGNAGILDASGFRNLTVNPTDTLIQYGPNGDLNMDGQVTYLDYGVIDNAYLTHAAPSYAHGDVNFDGVINYLDYGMMDNAFLAQNAPAPVANAAAAATVVTPGAGVFATTLIAKRPDTTVLGSGGQPVTA